jgi:hypothetical protein
MKTFLFIAVLCVATTPVLATTSFFDDFESGVQGSIWTKWTGSSQEILQTSTSHNHTPAGSKAALAVEADPTAYSGYAEFGSTADSIRAEVYLFEDLTHDGTNPAQPVTNMLCLVGDTGGSIGFGADYLQIGVVPFWPGGSTTYGFRTAYGDAGHGNSQSFGVPRKQGWTKLAIEADSIASGGQVRFYIDDVLMPITSQRTATNLRWVRLGNNSKSYENFWYDDVKVTPEPASLLLLGLPLCLVRRRAR